MSAHEGVTKADLLKLLEPYSLNEQIVFVTIEDGIVVHERIEVAKDHCTTRTAPDGSVSMPIAIYLIDEGTPGRASVMGLDSKDILPEGWPKPTEDFGEQDETNESQPSDE